MERLELDRLPRTPPACGFGGRFCQIRIHPGDEFVGGAHLDTIEVDRPNQRQMNAITP
jgi:hypothetical protein